MSRSGIRVAFSTISCPEYTMAQMADAVRRYGYDGIEFYALEGARLTPDVLATRLDEARRTFLGIPIVSINSWGTLSSADPDERRRQEAQIRHTFELAADVGCPLVKTFGGALPVDRDRADVFDYMADSLWRLGARAGELGVTLIVETHDGFCLGSDLGALLASVEHPHVAALWDVHHPYRMGEDPAQTDGFIGHRVAHAHVKDAVRTGEGWTFVPLGTGELPVRAMLSHLRMRNFRGYVAVDWEKMWHPEIDGPEQALPHHVSVLREYLDSAAS